MAEVTEGCERRVVMLQVSLRMPRRLTNCGMLTKEQLGG